MRSLIATAALAGAMLALGGGASAESLWTKTPPPAVTRVTGPGWYHVRAVGIDKHLVFTWTVQVDVYVSYVGTSAIRLGQVWEDFWTWGPGSVGVGIVNAYNPDVALRGGIYATPTAVNPDVTTLVNQTFGAKGPSNAWDYAGHFGLNYNNAWFVNGCPGKGATFEVDPHSAWGGPPLSASDIADLGPSKFFFATANCSV
jgi:hypothetical protein